MCNGLEIDGSMAAHNHNPSPTRTEIMQVTGIIIGQLHDIVLERILEIIIGKQCYHYICCLTVGLGGANSTKYCSPWPKLNARIVSRHELAGATWKIIIRPIVVEI